MLLGGSNLSFGLTNVLLMLLWGHTKELSLHVTTTMLPLSGSRLMKTADNNQNVTEKR